MSASARKKIVEMHEEITKLREQVAAQAAVIESNKEVFEYLLNQLGDIRDIKIVKAALAIPTDSTQILDEVRRAEREECAKRAEAYAYMSQNFIALAEEIRAME